MRAFEQAWAFLKAEDPFRMKRPEMVDETTGIMDELARREWNRGDKGKDEFGTLAEGGASLDEYGRIEHGDPVEDLDHISDETFRSERPEMEERLLALQTELARRGKPVIGEKFMDRFQDSEDAEYSDGTGLGNLSENMDLVDEMGARAKESQSEQVAFEEWLDDLGLGFLEENRINDDY